MEMRKQDKTTLLLTYDYELFLGRSGTVEKCLIEPTNELRKVMKAHDAHGTFFVDTVYLLRVRKESKSDYEKVERQLLDLVNDGHRVELHLHPHWVDAKYKSEKGQWFFDNFRYYRVGNCPEDLIDSLFEQSVGLLSGICGQVDSNYSPYAYRAGGWCIEPFSAFARLFKEYGIVADSSILPMQYSEDKTQGFDYRSIISNEAYRFAESPLKPNTAGCFVEIPVTTIQLPISKIISLRLKMLANKDRFKMMGDGVSSLVQNGAYQSQSIVSKISDRLKKPQYRSLAFEGACYEYPKSSLSDNNLYTSITHPKLVSYNSLREMDRVLGFVDSAITIRDYVVNVL